jgi:hypothetical protein
MPLVLAFDQSIARTGWCLYEPPAYSSILIGSFTSLRREKANCSWAIKFVFPKR